MWTDGRTYGKDMTKLIVAFRSFANATKNYTSDDTSSHVAARTSNLEIRLKLYSHFSYFGESDGQLYTHKNGETHFKHRVAESNFVTFLLMKRNVYTKPMSQNIDRLKPAIQSVCGSADGQTPSVVWNKIVILTYRGTENQQRG